MHILYVEDSIETARALKKLLERHGHRVDLAHTGRDAKALCTQIVFDLLVIDLGLPDFHGGDLLRTLRRMCDTRAIAISGYGRSQDIEEAKDDGFDAYLVKPVSLDIILDTINRFNQGAGVPTPMIQAGDPFSASNVNVI